MEVSSRELFIRYTRAIHEKNHGVSIRPLSLTSASSMGPRPAQDIRFFVYNMGGNFLFPSPVSTCDARKKPRPRVAVGKPQEQNVCMLIRCCKVIGQRDRILKDRQQLPMFIMAPYGERQSAPCGLAHPARPFRVRTPLTGKPGRMNAAPCGGSMKQGSSISRSSEIRFRCLQIYVFPQPQLWSSPQFRHCCC